MRVVLGTVYLLLLGAAAFAQSDRGVITGTVADEQRAFIPKAVVIARNSETGAHYETVSTATGNYTITSLPSGVYQLSVETSGFKRYLQQGIIVQVAQTVRVDVVMPVGAASESVTVNAAAPLLKTENAEQSTNISGELFNSLPLNVGATNSIRSWLSFIQLAPGVSGTTWADSS